MTGDRCQITGQSAMEPKLIDLYNRLKKSGLTPEQDQKIRLELNDTGTHDLPGDNSPGTETKSSTSSFRDIYAFHDLADLQGMTAMRSNPTVSIRSIDELLQRD